MAKPKYDLGFHNEGYENSGLTMKEYCVKAGVNMKTLQNFRYLQNKTENKKSHVPSFQEYVVGTRFVISAEKNGFSIHDLSSDQLSRVIHALSE